MMTSPTSLDTRTSVCFGSHLTVEFRLLFAEGNLPFLWVKQLAFITDLTDKMIHFTSTLSDAAVASNLRCNHAVIWLSVQPSQML